MYYLCHLKSFWNWSLAFDPFKTKCIICAIQKGIIMTRKPRPASPILNIINVFTAKSWVGLLLYNTHICFSDCSHHFISPYTATSWWLCCYNFHYHIPYVPLLSVILNLISNQNLCFPNFIVRHQAAIAGTVGFAFLVAICMEQVSISFFSSSKFHLTWKSQSIIKDYDNLIIWVTFALVV